MALDRSPLTGCHNTSMSSGSRQEFPSCQIKGCLDGASHDYGSSIREIVLLDAGSRKAIEFETKDVSRRSSCTVLFYEKVEWQDFITSATPVSSRLRISR